MAVVQTTDTSLPGLILCSVADGDLLSGLVWFDTTLNKFIFQHLQTLPKACEIKILNLFVLKHKIQ